MSAPDLSLQRAKALQALLHETPELSGCETRTKGTLMDFLRENSDLDLVDC